MKKSILVLILLLFIFSCTTHRIDMPQDKEEAEKVLNKYYQFILKKEYEKVIPILSDSFLYVTDSKKIVIILDSLNNQNGKLKGYKLSKFRTLVSNGEKLDSKYWLEYDVDYENRDMRELFNLRKDEDGKIRIYFLDAINIKE